MTLGPYYIDGNIPEIDLDLFSVTNNICPIEKY